jgi:DNA-directed RNA polymerase subunit RPC12/RpoP
MGLITEKIKIKITNNRNIGHYKEYINKDIKLGDEIDIEIFKLPMTSKEKVEVKCDICGKIFEISYFSYIRNITNGGYYSCKKCCSKKIIKNNDEQDFLDTYKKLGIIKTDLGLYYEKLNLIIEIKSRKWYDEHLEKNISKRDSCRKQGYNFIFIIDKDYSIFDMIIKHDIYDKEHCWQYELRLNTYNEDLEFLKINDIDISDINIKDFDFKYIDSNDKIECENIKKFIEKYEWLGKMPNRPTHRFISTYKGILAGVIVMATPNNFSKYFGKSTKDIEKLISRGACASWTPKNLASSLLMWSIKWMVKNTQFRIFSAYSDTEAREIGTIYQACNFYYIGQNFGSDKLYFDLDNPHIGWTSGRNFRKKSFYKKIAKENGIIWQDKWIDKYTIKWEFIPEDVKTILITESKLKLEKCLLRKTTKKHKYIYVLGKDNSETKRLRKLFLDNVNTYSYPKRIKTN